MLPFGITVASLYGCFFTAPYQNNNKESEDNNMRTKEQFEKEMVDFRLAIRGHWGTGFFKAVVEYMKSKGYEQPVIIKLSEIPNYLHVHFFTDNVRNEYGIVFAEAFVDESEFSPCPLYFVESKSIFKKDMLPNMEKAALDRMMKAK